MPVGNGYWLSGVNTQQANTSVDAALNSASSLQAYKYSSFDSSPTFEEYMDLSGDKLRKRKNEYINQVLDRQYEMDVRQHQEDLENSAYQRAVADMKKAGLNPYWMFNNSAGTVAASDTSEAKKYSSSKKDGSSGSKTATEIFKALIRVIGTAAMMSILA